MQGRFKAALVEDEGYFWAVSRYVHLNPVRGKRPLVARPADWAWSSYPGYARRSARVGWVAYEAIYSAWRGEMGGSQVETAYRRFVEQGPATMPEDPFREAVGGWLLGGSNFVERVRAGLTIPRHPDAVPAARQLVSLDYRAVLADVAKHFGITVESFREQRSGDLDRDLAAWLARELTPVTLRELSAAFGLTHPDSVGNLVDRANRALRASARLRDEIDAIRQMISKTGNRP